MITCYRCAKTIKGTVTRHVPSLLAIQIGADFERAYHPACYERDEADAAEELRPVAQEVKP